MVLIFVLFLHKNNKQQMKIVVDDKIPYIREAIEKLGFDVTYCRGNEFRDCSALDDAEALIIRTRTKCDEQLLSGTNIRFIATATIGYDHIDTDFLDKNDIKWTNCPGCNAASVAQYIRNSLLVLSKNGKLQLNKAVVGVVGVGHVGKEVVKALDEIGVNKILLNDPPRAEKEGIGEFHSLEELFAECDVITLHTPLTKTGKYPTYLLIDEQEFGHIKKQPIVINAARGGVVNEKALISALDEGIISDVVIDTWENEPEINRELLEKAVIATPHIAGYSADGKANASRMALMAVCDFFGILPDFDIQPPALDIDLPKDKIECYLELYNPLKDCLRLKEEPEKFEYFRENYPLRREQI